MRGRSNSTVFISTRYGVSRYRDGDCRERRELSLRARSHRDIGPYPNTWHLLGGGVKLGEESCEEALRREIREEAGIELAEVRRVSFDEDYEPNKHGVMTHYVFLVYWARCVSETTRAWFIRKSAAIMG
ncbi:MAG: NUDIX domain-containing protein [Verrucomicrobiota bacterium]